MEGLMVTSSPSIIPPVSKTAFQVKAEVLSIDPSGDFEAGFCIVVTVFHNSVDLNIQFYFFWDGFNDKSPMQNVPAVCKSFQ